MKKNGRLRFFHNILWRIGTLGLGFRICLDLVYLIFNDFFLFSLYLLFIHFLFICRWYIALLT